MAVGVGVFVGRDTGEPVPVVVVFPPGETMALMYTKTRIKAPARIQSPATVNHSLELRKLRGAMACGAEGRSVGWEAGPCNRM